MKRRFIECLNKDEWERELFLNQHFQLREAEEETGYTLSLSLDGRGDFRDEDLWSVPFKWQTKDEDLSLLAAEELMAHLEGEDDFRFARDFIQMSEDERWNQTWRWKNGNQHELKQVLTWVFLAQEELWQQETELWFRLSLTGNQNNSGVVVYSGPLPIRGKDAPHPLTPALHEAVLKAIAHFKPTLNRAHIEQHEVLLRLLQTDIWRININPDNPTAHERIEAAIKWRQWLAEHELSS